MKFTKALRITIATTAIVTAAAGTHLGVQAITGGTTNKPTVDAVKTEGVYIDEPVAATPEPSPATQPATEAGTVEPVAQSAPAAAVQTEATPAPSPSTAPAQVIYPPQPDGTPTTAGYYSGEVTTFDYSNK